MANFALGLVVEGAVALLLVITIGYCYILNARLKRLRNDRMALQTMITDLVRATEQATGAISQLRKTATECDAMIESRLSDAERFSIELAHHVTAGHGVVYKIAQITKAAGTSDMSTSSGKARAALDQLQRFAKSNGEAA